MIRFYRRIPERVKAVRWTGHNICEIAWFTGMPVTVICKGFKIFVHNLGLVEKGEFIVKDSQHLYTMRGKNFRKTFERE